jgi:chorismate mutase
LQSEEYHANLEKLRQQINNLDDELMQILSQRMKVAEKIGQYKKDNDITILAKLIVGIQYLKELLRKVKN